jgi:hypothetical protein
MPLRIAFALGLVGLMFAAFGVGSLANGSARDGIESLAIAPLLLFLSFLFGRRYIRSR